MTELTDGGDTVTEAGGADSTSAAPRDYEAEARQHGWTPKEDFRGDAAKWVDAETFARRADEVMPFLQKQNKGLKHEIDELKKTIRQSAEFFSKAEERAYQKALTELQVKHNDAVEMGDVAGANAAMREFTALEKPVAIVTPVDDPPPADAHQQIQSWIDDSPWYQVDDNRTKYADLVSNTLTKDHGALHKFPGGIPAALKEIEARVDRKFAEKKPSPVNGGGNRSVAGGNGKSFADLPPQAQQMADKWVKQKLIPDRAAYLKAYQW